MGAEPNDGGTFSRSGLTSSFTNLMIFQQSAIIRKTEKAYQNKKNFIFLKSNDKT